MHTIVIICALLAASGGAFAQSAPPPEWVEGYRLRYTLGVLDDQAPVESSAKTIVAALPAGSWIEEAGSVVVQASDGRILPVAVVAHDPATRTLIRFPRMEGSASYYAYFSPTEAHAPPKPIETSVDPAQSPEGIFAQVRDWDGPSLDSWADVRNGMVAGDVQGHAWVSEVAHYSNPAQPQRTSRFAISYRGHLKIDEPGQYRIAANGEHALFLFIDGQLVQERAGTGPLLQGNMPTDALGTVVELSAGTHTFEYHQAVGDAADVTGVGMLLWMKPGETDRWSVVPRSAFVQPLLAEPVALAHAEGSQATGFAYGIEHYIPADGFDMYIVRFEATGNITEPNALQWDLGDGQTARGRSVTHLYFEKGTYQVELDSGSNLPLHSRRIAVWQPPVPTSPLTLSKAVKLIGETDLDRVDPVQLNRMFVYLLQCDQSSRWPVLEKVARHTLSLGEFDRDYQVQLYLALIESMARQNRAHEAVKLADDVVSEFEQIESLAAQIMLAAADVQRDFGGDLRDAVHRYQAILEQYRRIESPVVRRAAIHLGDLYARNGDLDAALEAYETASELGGPQFDQSVGAAAAQQGATLRVVEQKLREGDTGFAKRLLAKIELENPQQKVEGYYQLLAGEVDRVAGRYEQALQAYELVLASPQWAGLRGRAMLGAAKCNARLERFDEALRWLDLMESTQARFFQDNNVSAYRERVETRRRRVESSSYTPFEGLSIGFENDEDAPELSAAPPIIVARGIDGPRVVCAWQPGGNTRLRLNVDTPPLEPDRKHWLGYWYRTVVGNLAQTGMPAIYINLDATGGTASSSEPWPVWGQWVHAGEYIEPENHQQPRLMIETRRMYGLFMLDGVTLAPVGVRKADALSNFLQGESRP
ncbi:MAG: tetratricopeptide repeat protein [bacterium]